ncbi:CopD family protein [Aliihoeflea sp. PC F10.4]
MVWLKFIHMAAISIWCAGLICLPGLYAQRHAVEGDALYRLQGLVRFAYVSIISPAAFVSIGSGIALIFLQATFVEWFSVKMAFVGVLVVIHILTGLVIIRLFEDGESYPGWRFVGVTIATTLVVFAILVVVLAKPPLHWDWVPVDFTRPGALRDFVAEFIPSLSR